VQGPDSKNVLKDLVGPAVLDLGYYYFMSKRIDGIPVVITRTGWTAEVGYEIYLTDGRRGVELWDRIMEAGKKYDIRPIAPSEIRRIEGGILNYGSDMTLENNPYEVGLGWLVDLNKKADFVGKKALAKIKKEGVKRKLVGVEIEGPQIHAWATEFWDVKKNGKKVGHLTALTYSPRLQENIAYAWVPIRLAKLGTPLAEGITGFGSRPDPRAEPIPGAAIARMLATLKETFAFTVVDATSEYSDHVLAALDLSDAVCLVTTLDAIGVRHLSIAMQTLQSLGIPRNRLRFVVNGANSKVDLRVEDIERLIGVRMDGRIPSSPLVPRSINRGRLLWSDQRRSEVAKGVEAFADQLRATLTPELVAANGHRRWRRG